jgi:hypothetical protein
MTQDITQLVDDPELIDAADDITLDRWTKYGHDRLYINGARVEPYIDLEDGSLGDTGRVRVDTDFDGDTVTVEIGDEDGHSRHDVIVISLSGGVDEDDEESDDEQEDDGEPETDADGEFDRIETIDEKPGVDTATVREGDVLELVSGEPGSEGAQFRVETRNRGFNDSFTLDVEQVAGPRTSRREIVDNGTGPMFEPVVEADA